MAVIIDMPMPECCDLCKFGCWSTLRQTAECYLTDDTQMFDEFSKDYRTRRSAKCPMIEYKPGKWYDTGTAVVSVDTEEQLEALKGMYPPYDAEMPCPPPPVGEGKEE